MNNNERLQAHYTMAQFMLNTPNKQLVLGFLLDHARDLSDQDAADNLEYINRKAIEGPKGPPVKRCECGEGVTLYGFTNECNQCGRLYNGSGQVLAPRNQWGW